MRAVAGFVCAFVLASCQLEVTYDNARFVCESPSDRCPEGMSCVLGECVRPSGAGADAAPDAEPLIDPVDAGTDPDPIDAGFESIDASAGLEMRTFTLGERNGADFQDVSRDTFLTEEFPNDSHTGSTELATDSSPVQRTLMRWDLTDLPAGAQVVSADLTLVVNDPLENGDFVAFALKESFVEKATFFLRDPDNSLGWSTPGAGANSRFPTIMASFAPRTPAEYTVSLSTAVVQTWLDDAGDNFGMVWATHTNVTDTRGGEWYSSDVDNQAQRPELRLIVLVPTN